MLFRFFGVTLVGPVDCNRFCLVNKNQRSLRFQSTKLHLISFHLIYNLSVHFEHRQLMNVNVTGSLFCQQKIRITYFGRVNVTSLADWATTSRYFLFYYRLIFWKCTNVYIKLQCNFNFSKYFTQIYLNNVHFSIQNCLLVSHAWIWGEIFVNKILNWWSKRRESNYIIAKLSGHQEHVISVATNTRYTNYELHFHLHGVLEGLTYYYL